MPVEGAQHPLYGLFSSSRERAWVRPASIQCTMAWAGHATTSAAAMVIGVVHRERKAQSAPASLRRLTCSLCSALLSFGYFSGSILSVVFLADPSTPCGRGRPNVTATFKLIQSQHSSQKRNRKPLMRRRVPAVCVWKPFPTEDNHHYYYYYCHNHYHWLKSVCAGSNDETPLVGGNGSDTVKVDDWPSGGDWGTATHLTDLIFLSLFSLSREGRFCFSFLFFQAGKLKSLAAVCVGNRAKLVDRLMEKRSKDWSTTRRSNSCALCGSA